MHPTSVLAPYRTQLTLTTTAHSCSCFMQNDMLRKDIFQLTAYLLDVCITRLCTLGVSSGNAAGILFRHARDVHLDIVAASLGLCTQLTVNHLGGMSSECHRFLRDHVRGQHCNVAHIRGQRCYDTYCRCLGGLHPDTVCVQTLACSVQSWVGLEVVPMAVAKVSYDAFAKRHTGVYEPLAKHADRITLARKMLPEHKFCSRMNLSDIMYVGYFLVFQVRLTHVSGCNDLSMNDFYVRYCQLSTRDFLNTVSSYHT